VLLAGLALLAGCADEPVGRDGQPFRWIGEVRVEVVTPVSSGAGELRHTVTWGSDGRWRSVESISYGGLLGDETVFESNGDRGSLARSYATWIALVNDTPSIRLFTDLLDPALDPNCRIPTSRVVLTIADRIRGDSIRWTRCAQTSLHALSGEAGPDLHASRVTQAAALVRNFTLAQQRNFRFQYVGSVPFATVARGQSAVPLTSPRVIADGASWRSFWDSVTAGAQEVPAVDFGASVVLVGVVGTRREAGDSVEIRGVLPVGSGTQIQLWEQRAGHFCTPARRTHVPYHIVVAPLVPRPIFFSDVSLDTIPCG